MHDYDDAQAGRPRARTRAFFHGMLDRGVFLAPSGYETMFVSLAHTDADLDRTSTLAAEAARERQRPLR